MPKSTTSSESAVRAGAAYVNETIPVGAANPPQVTLPVELPTAHTFIVSAGARIMRVDEGGVVEVFDGDGWLELKESRPDGVKLRSYHSPMGVPEAYVRADASFIMLWPAPAYDTLFRVTGG